ncbi:DUF1934 domain-containing protein [Bhargavaea cecembensis]|uniref:DUF1934 domain-containing protein n=1 Tax=Bhargavaea cecembensis TaxID=394098 RepID=UPI0015CF5D67|nr:DUF1934 domain-containing protein [Bhargavaea cecembensis]
MTNPAEGKAVAIRLISTITQPGEHPARHIVKADGRLTEKGGRLWLRFEEREEGREVRTTVRMGHDEALILRNGDVTMRLPLVPGEEREGTYGFGNMGLPLIVRTELMDFRPGEEGRFTAVYHLIAGEEKIGTYKVEFTYSEGKS